MARIIKKICFITIVFLVAISIKVYANDLTLDCQESINPETENTIEYVLKGNFTDNVNSIKVRYTIPDGVEFQGFTPSDEWNLEQGGIAGTTGLVLRISDGDVNGEIEFGKFTFSVPNTYNKESIAFKIYGLDATNTSCEVVEFSQDEVNKSIVIEKQDDNNPNDNQGDENNNPSDNNNNGNNNNNNNNNEENDEQGNNNNSNTQTGSEDDEGKNGEYGENTNADSNDKDDKNKNNNGSKNINSNIGSASAGSKNDNNSLNQKSDKEKDTTVTQIPFGQYGNGKIITVLIVVILFTVFIVYKKLKKLNF